VVDHLLRTLRFLLNLCYLIPTTPRILTPTLAVASSCDKLPSKYKDKDSDVTSGDGEHKEKGNNADMESVVASGSGDQSLTQAQDPNVPREPMSSTTEPPPDLQGASDLERARRW